jgi:hypothetical protein
VRITEENIAIDEELFIHPGERWEGEREVILKLVTRKDIRSS